MYGFTVLINLTCAKVHGLAAQPAEMMYGGEHFWSPARTVHQVAQETDARMGAAEGCVLDGRIINNTAETLGTPKYAQNSECGPTPSSTRPSDGVNPREDFSSLERSGLSEQLFGLCD